MNHTSRLLSFLVAFALGAGGLFLTGCDSNGGFEGDDELRSVTYDLTAQTNDGALPDGVNATATFQELDATTTLVTLELESNTGAALAHPAHIHENSASEGGPIAIYLSPIDGTGGSGTSSQVVNRSFDDLAGFDGYINIHESPGALGNIVSQGNIGANADDTGDGGTPAY
jgi:hypothetical protein